MQIFTFEKLKLDISLQRWIDYHILWWDEVVEGVTVRIQRCCRRIWITCVHPHTSNWDPSVCEAVCVCTTKFSKRKVLFYSESLSVKTKWNTSESTWTCGRSLEIMEKAQRLVLNSDSIHVSQCVWDCLTSALTLTHSHILFLETGPTSSAATQVTFWSAFRH